MTKPSEESHKIVRSTLMNGPIIENHKNPKGTSMNRKIGMILVLILPLLAPRVNYAQKTTVHTSDMTPNIGAHVGLEDLVDLLDVVTIDAAALRDALEKTRLYQEGVDADGVLLALGDSGVTCHPHSLRPVFKRCNYDRYKIIVEDNNSHMILREDVVTDLIAGEFFEVNDHYLIRDTANTAIHELLHSMIFQTGCFRGTVNKEETLVHTLTTFHITAKVKVYLLIQDGKMDEAISAFNGLVRNINANLDAHKQWRECYEVLGLPGTFPEPESVWLSFLEGDPGIPGDGVVISPSGGNQVSGFELATPYPLKDVSDGITLSFFPTNPHVPHVPDFGVSFDILSSSQQCIPNINVGSIGQPGEIILFNGAQGGYMNYTQSQLESIVNIFNQHIPAGCDSISLNDLYITSIYRNTLPKDTPLDAATIQLGENVFPLE